MTRSNRNNELLKAVSANETPVVLRAQWGHRRPVILPPGSHIAAFCQYVTAYPMFCSAHVCVLLVGIHACRLLWFVCLGTLPT